MHQDIPIHHFSSSTVTQAKDKFMNSSFLDQQAAVYSIYAGDPEMSELVEFFVSQVPERVKSFRRAFEEEDLEELCRLAHQLKGASGSYGFCDLSPLAANLESLLKQAPTREEVSLAMEAFLSIYAHICVDAAE